MSMGMWATVEFFVIVGLLLHLMTRNNKDKD